MDDESSYGREFHRLSFSEAISQGLLSDYKVVVLAVREEPSSTLMVDRFGDDREIQADDVLKIKGCLSALRKEFAGAGASVRVEGGAAEIKDRRFMRRAVAFAGTIESSKRFARYFEEVAKACSGEKAGKSDLACSLRHVDGGMNALERDRAIRWIKGEDEAVRAGECRILSNARCLSEGVDVPSLDAVMFFEARKAEIDIVQSVGRVMRKPADPRERKEFGYIILPVVVRPDEDPSAALDDNRRYEVIWKVVQALRSHDDRLETAVDKLPWSRRLPRQIVLAGADEDSGVGRRLETEFLRPWNAAVTAKLVLKCGDREYLDKIALDVSKAFRALLRSMRASLRAKGRRRKALERFLASLRSTLNDSITEDDALEMLAIHSVTKPLFDALFATKGDFAKNNPVSRAMDEALSLFGSRAAAETRELDNAYESIKRRVGDIDSLEARQNLIKEIYQVVFKTSFPKLQEQLGIVYTPVEIVDFILESANEILKREFGGKTLSSEGVKILDPFSGTGTFVSRLFENRKLIKDEDLERKYSNEVFASEIVLLAYYITSINVAHSYEDRKGPDYKRFNGSIFADTFQSTEEDGKWDSGEFFRENDRRRQQLAQNDIEVIPGNPPWSAGQKNEDDNNKNMTYPTLDTKIKNTYVRDSRSRSTRKCYDHYVRAIKLATEKIKSNPQGGLIAFITNSSFIDAKSMDGLRHHLERDFTALYVLNLRGNARIRGDAGRREGGGVFGASTMCGVAISFLVFVRSLSGKKGKIHYHNIGDGLSGKSKLQILKDARHIFKLAWKKIKVDGNYDWVDQSDIVYATLMSMDDDMFSTQSLGIVTNRDVWVYDFNEIALSKNVKKTISFYNKETARFKKQGGGDIDGFVDNDPTKISWSHSLKASLKKGRHLKYDATKIRQVMYRPFCKMRLYYDKQLNERHRQTPRTHPRAETRNLSICVSGAGAREFSVFMTDLALDLNSLEVSLFFPRYSFKDGKKTSNISAKTVRSFQARLGDESIDTDKIFFYIYGVLNSREYVKRFRADLLKGAPRIPVVGSARDFHAISRIGRELSGLHVGYERIQVPKEDKLDVEVLGNKSDPATWRVEKMRHPGTGDKKDLTTVICNDRVTIRNIPRRAHGFKINSQSAIWHVMRGFRVRRCKKSGIVRDPNDKDNPRHIVDLLERVVHVSMRTLDLIDDLDAFDLLKESESLGFVQEAA